MEIYTQNGHFRHFTTACTRAGGKSKFYNDKRLLNEKMLSVSINNFLQIWSQLGVPNLAWHATSRYFNT